MLQGDKKEGVVKCVLYDQNYGFITGDDGLEYFFHVREVSNGRPVFERMTPGDHVKFFKSIEQRDEADGRLMAYAAIRIRVQQQ